MRIETLTAVEIDGKLFEELPDGTLIPLVGETDWARIDAMTEDEIAAIVANDPDARPMTDAEWEAAPPVPLAETPMGWDFVEEPVEADPDRHVPLPMR